MPKVLLIGYVWPEIKSSAAGLRTENILDTFLERGWEVHFASAATPTPRSAEPGKMVGVVSHSILSNHSSFDVWIRELDPDFVVFDRFVTEEQFGWRVRENLPRAVRILDTQDLHFLRRARERAVLAGEDFSLLSEDALREVASISRCDGALILSQFEVDLLKSQFGLRSEQLHLSRFHYPAPPLSLHSYDDRKGFVMIGNFRHRPNADGVRWFRKEIWPQIWAEFRKEAQIYIYGAYPSREMMDLSDSSLGFYVRGPVDDPAQVLSRHRVSLAPLRFGAGIKGKITDSWWNGTPVVATEIGAEGMVDDCPWGGMIGENAEDFAAKAIQIYQDPVLWHQAQTNGYQIMNQLYNNAKNSAALFSYFEWIRTHLHQLRESNWFSRMIEYHSFRSSKYFSKWIEEKNRPIASRCEEKAGMMSDPEQLEKDLST